MFVYILIILSVILYGIVASTLKTKIVFKYRNKEFDFLGLLLLLLLFFATFRGEFTEDHKAYISYFMRVSELPIFEILNFNRSFSMERGFILLCKIISIISISKVFFVFVISLITLSLYFRMLKKWSLVPWLSVLLFVSIGDYFASYNLMRQILSAALSLAALELLLQKKYWKYIVSILLISFIHTTALVMLPVGYILMKKISFKQYSLLTVGTLVVMIVLPQVISLIQMFFPKYAGYTYGMSSGSINAVIPLIGIVGFMLYSIYVDQDCTFDVDIPMNRIMINGTILSMIFLILGTQVYMVTRLAYFLKPFSWVLVCNLVYSYREQNKRFVFITAISVLAIVYIWITLSHTGYNPYYFVWS